MWPDGNETLKLLDQARDGADSGRALDRLLERHREKIRRLVGLRMDPALGARLDASDIVQDAMVEAARRFPRYLDDRPLPFHLWLRQLAIDSLIDAHRKHRKAKRRTVDREARAVPEFSDRSSLDLLERLSEQGDGPKTLLLRQELHRRFRDGVEELSADDREVIFMRHLEQLSNQEVAQVLGLSEPAAGMRYLRALRRLRAVLEKDQPAESQG